MNYLAHAFFSGKNESILTGNMIGDFVKGKLMDYPIDDAVKKGVELHRDMDEFADQHIATQKAKNLFRSSYGLYSGAIVDVLYDYFLANDPLYFANERLLEDFTLGVYQTLRKNEHHFPDKFEHMLTHMENDNWLYDIRTLKGLRTALSRLEHRAKEMKGTSDAYETIVKHYYELNQIYFEYIQDFDTFVKIKLS